MPIPFQLPWALVFAVVLAAGTAWLLIYSRRRRNARLARLGTPEMIARLAPGALLRQSRLGIVIGTLAVLLAGLAFAGPRWGFERTVVRQSGIDMVLALDASASMLATDEAPNRLEAMKNEVRRLRASGRGNRVALIAFAGRSYVLTPLTIDDGGLDLFLDNLDPSVVGQAGSSLAPPLRQATALLSLSKSPADKAVVLMSDGEGFEDADAVVDAAEKARKAGISVITVGFGTRQGSTIPVTENGRVSVKRDDAGAVVTTRYEPALLQEAARVARGTFVAADAGDRVASIVQALSQLKAEQRSVENRENLAHRYQFFLLPAFLLLVLDALMPVFASGRRRRLRTFVSTLPDRVRPRGFGASASRARRRAAGTAGVAAALLLILSGCRQLFPDPTLDNYNAGTKELQRDSLGRAEPLLRMILESQRDEIAWRGEFNMGLVHLKRGLALQRDSADPPLDSALVHYRIALRRRPDVFDAKWNYELALRK
ncbi:MAG: VWA domain-containing protein, partial [Gemmatimonadota bacterium]|nr:VWA domain-containing protein [Gemmatimonadota bacterium]